jgi:hypothetical protein
MADVEKRYSITGDAALKIMNAVYERANAMGKAVYIAVTDGTGGLGRATGPREVPGDVPEGRPGQGLYRLRHADEDLQMEGLCLFLFRRTTAR